MNVPKSEIPVQLVAGFVYPDTGKRVIAVRVEKAQVDILREHTGTVRVHKVVHAQTGTAVQEGFREVAETTRAPVNQVVETVEAPRNSGDVLVIPVYEERLVRQLVLVEEMHVHRRREFLENTLPMPLQREEAMVERLNPTTRQWVLDDS